MAKWNVEFDPKIDVRRAEIVELVIELEALRRSVLKIPLPPTFRKRLDQINIVRHIKGTTGIEGNTLTEERIEEVLGETEEDGTRANGSTVEEREVINAGRVYRFIREHVASNPDGYIDEELIRKLHFLTTEGCNYENNIPGVYRNHPVVAGSYTPPDHNDVPRLMKEFVQFINSRPVREGYKALLRAILAHFYLISIHPFGDGNGRTSRALEAYILYQGGYNVRGFYSLANFYYRNRAQYIEALQAARFKHKGDLTEFVIFSLRGFLEELEDIQERILDFVRRRLFRDVYLEALEHKRINARGYAVVEHLTFHERDGIPADMFKNRSHYLAKGLYEGLTLKTLLRDLRNLQSLGFIVDERGILKANLKLMDEFM